MSDTISVFNTTDVPYTIEDQIVPGLEWSIVDPSNEQVNELLRSEVFILGPSSAPAESTDESEPTGQSGSDKTESAGSESAKQKPTTRSTRTKE